MTMTRGERKRMEFVEEAKHRGFAHAPKSLVVDWFGQEKFSKGIKEEFVRLSEDEEIFPKDTRPVQVYETPLSEILLVCDLREW
jgi:hypothetical protein